MSEMIKRVARAITTSTMDDGVSFGWEERLARVAIAAMRDPTPEMVNVGVSVVNFLRAEDARLVWQVMIDVARVEKEGAK
jgi:hypothetical protein